MSSARPLSPHEHRDLVSSTYLQVGPGQGAPGHPVGPGWGLAWGDLREPAYQQGDAGPAPPGHPRGSSQAAWDGCGDVTGLAGSGKALGAHLGDLLQTVVPLSPVTVTRAGPLRGRDTQSKWLVQPNPQAEFALPSLCSFVSGCWGRSWGSGATHTDPGPRNLNEARERVSDLTQKCTAEVREPARVGAWPSWGWGGEGLI